MDSSSSRHQKRRRTDNEGQSSLQDSSHIINMSTESTVNMQSTQTENIEAPPSSSNTMRINTIPRTTSIPCFIGREEELLKLRTLCIEQTARHNIFDVLVSGRQGVGKSHLIKKFLMEQRSTFRNIIWIPSENCHSIEQEFYKLAQHLGIAVGRDLQIIINNVYWKLQNEKTLIVFDNVLIDCILKYLPSFADERTNTIVIVTSVIEASNWEGNYLKINLQPFTIETLQQYFFQEINNMSNGNECTKIECARMSQFCEGLPVAMNSLLLLMKKQIEFGLIQFGKDLDISCLVKSIYINVKKCRHNKSHKNCCVYSCIPESMLEHPAQLCSILDQTLQRIRVTEDGALALHLLDIMALLNKNKILLEVLKLFTLEDNLKNAILLLKRYSLITTEGNKIEISGVVQNIMRHRPSFNSTKLSNNILKMFSRYDKEKAGKLLESKEIKNANIFRHHILNLYPFLNDKTIKRYKFLFLKASLCISKVSKALATVSTMYKRINLVPQIGKLKLHCLYLAIVIKLKAYETVITVTDKFIKQLTMEKLKDSLNGALILFYRSHALFELNKVSEAWLLCNNIYHINRQRLLNNPIDFKSLTFKSFSLLCRITCVMEPIPNMEPEFKVEDQIDRCCKEIKLLHETSCIHYIHSSILSELSELNQAWTEALSYILQFLLEKGESKKALHLLDNIKTVHASFYSINCVCGVLEFIAFKVLEIYIHDKNFEMIKNWFDQNSDLLESDLTLTYTAYDYTNTFNNISNVLLRISQTAQKLQDPDLLFSCIWDLHNVLTSYKNPINFGKIIECTDILKQTIEEDPEKYISCEICFDYLHKYFEELEDKEQKKLISSRIDVQKALFICKYEKDVQQAWKVLRKVCTVLKLDTTTVPVEVHDLKNRCLEVENIIMLKLKEFNFIELLID